VFANFANASILAVHFEKLRELPLRELRELLRELFENYFENFEKLPSGDYGGGRREPITSHPHK